MKTFYLFLLIMFIFIGSYAQKTTTAYQKAVIQPSGITNEGQSFSIEKVYPNPVKDFVTIELRSEISGEVKLSLINILGTEVKKWDEFIIYKGTQKIKIDLTSIKTGVYIIKITQFDQVRTQLLKKN